MGVRVIARTPEPHLRLPAATPRASHSAPPHGKAIAAISANHFEDNLRRLVAAVDHSNGSQK